MLACFVLAHAAVEAAQRRKGPAGPPRKGPAKRAGGSPLVRDAAVLLQAGKVREAEVAVRRAINADPLDAEAHALYGVVLDQLGRREEAENAFRRALILDPKSAGAWANLGVLLVRAGRGEEGAKAFEEALRLSPNHAEAAHNLALLHLARP